MLHANLVMIGGKKTARKKFEDSFKRDGIERPVLGAVLKNAPKQLSYILKFTTYHRPHEQRGSTKSQAKALNPREHAALLEWMSQFDFQDFLFLVNAKRQGGTRIVFAQHSTNSK